tara:strand:+ start:434 stop:664 length:231 start_codon:yes stop_codon:yes gene_type:complete
MTIKTEYGEIHIVVEYNNERDKGRVFMDNFVEDIQRLLDTKYPNEILLIKGDEWNQMDGSEWELQDAIQERGEGFE